MRRTCWTRFQRWVAGLTAGIFCINSLAWPLPSELSNLGSDAKPLLIPRELGTVEETDNLNLTNSLPWVIHISDVHADPSAQKKIRDILHYLTAGAIPPLLVAVEGASGPLHP